MSLLTSLIAFAANLILLHTNVATSTSEWISHSHNTIPRGDTMMAVGHVNDTIYLLGGFFSRQQMTIYDIQSDTFTYFKSGFLPNTTECFGEAQFWTQLDNNLYFLDDSNIQNTKLSLYNMFSNEFISDFATIPNRVTVSDGMGRACVTSIDNLIYVNGGISEIISTHPSIPLATTYILNINTFAWNLAPSMQLGRRSHSCLIHPMNRVLYSFGGDIIDGTMTPTIEKIWTINIYNNQWLYLNNNLTLNSTALRGLRSFIYKNTIVIIGGMDGLRNVKSDIHILDIYNERLMYSQSNIKLAFPSVYSAVIAVDNTMYSFGGGLLNEYNDDNEWQSMTIVDYNYNDFTTTNNNYWNPPNINTTFQIEEEEDDEAWTVRDQAAIGFGIVCFFICIGMSIYIWYVYYRRPKNMRNENDCNEGKFTKIDNKNEINDNDNEQSNVIANNGSKSSNCDVFNNSGSVDNVIVEDNEEKINLSVSSDNESDSTQSFQ